jgi:NAD(P)-dependent dehydrogenase (short-subunit alcohol dehydrogenase family)
MLTALNRVALITDVHTPLGDQLARRYLSEGYGVAASRPNQIPIETPLVSEDEDLLVIDWNRKSPISAKNVLLTALNRFDGIDQTLLLSAPEPEQKLLQETTTEAIDRAVDSWIKGSLFMIKAVLELYGRRQTGSLALINHLAQEQIAALPPLESTLRGGFTAAAEAILAGTGQQNVFVNGFESRTDKIEELADFIFDTMNSRGNRTSGRWYRFPPRSGILSALRQ